MIIHNAQDYKIGLGPTIDLDTSQGDWRLAYLKLNALSFGYATNTYWRFWVYYRKEKQFNFEKPVLPTYYYTPRKVLADISLKSADTTPAPKMKTGYTSRTMREFEDPSFPDWFIKLSWDYPCPHIDSDTNYVHPGEDRLLTQAELEALFGSALDDVPLKIKEYLEKHIAFYETGAWGDQDFEARYDKFRAKWVVLNANKKFIKHYDFSQWTPQLVCMESDRYPIANR